MQFVEYNGETYIKVNDLAREGDVISYDNIHHLWTDITANKLYLVINQLNEYILTILDDDCYEASVYGGLQGYDTPNDVNVYRKAYSNE